MRVLRGFALACSAAVTLSGLLPAQIILASNVTRSQRIESLLEKPARLEVQDVSLTVALTKLSTQSGVTVGFSPSILRSDAWTVACKCAGLTVADALDRLLAKLPLRYEERDNQIVVLPTVTPDPVAAPVVSPVLLMPTSTNQRVAADSIVSGKVVDEASRLPLADARITSSAGGRSAVTDARGRFRSDPVGARGDDHREPHRSPAGHATGARR